MKIAELTDAALHYREDGDTNGAPIVFANSLGTDLRLWDDVIPQLPNGLRILRFDKRGHGLSSCPAPPYSMGGIISDTEALLDHLGIKKCVFVGISIGGMIAQGLAVKRPDLIRAMVISNTAAKIGTRDTWSERIETVNAEGIESIADKVLEMWFTREFRATPEIAVWRNMLTRTPVAGYTGCCAAISHTDFYTTTASLGIPTLAIAGSEDGSTPPDLVRETADLVNGARFELMRGTGHLPCVEKPEAYARLLTSFMKEIGHV